MYKINKLTLKNFKFFYGEEPINFERKNVLIYGENGSGKSSIYWGLYTFLQSVLKKDISQIRKYFEHNHDQNLVNRFANETAESAVIVEFKDDSQSVQIKQISLNSVNTKDGQLIVNCNQASDFLNYKLLSKLYDFSNKNQIDLFPLFESDLLMFINFDLEFKQINGTIVNKNASDWWQYLKPGMDPRPKMHDPEYKIFIENITNFNSEFQKYLFKIIESTNDYVQKKFNQPFNLKLDYEDITYNDFILGSKTVRNHITIPPKIKLTVNYLHGKLNALKSEIKRPQTFLNEARLTTIALSLRLAMLDEKYIETAPKILVLDDLLISLDMSNRDIVLELIIKEFKNYQIIMLTHDRSFFHLMKKRIELECCSDDWLTKEIYQSETDLGIPHPFIPDNKDYLDQAIKYLKEFDYPASANYLRKETERLIKRLLPKNKTVYVSEIEGTKPLALGSLIDNFKEYYTTFDSDFTPFIKLKEYKDLLLNPLSHDNIDSPIYKQELISVIEVLKTMRLLDFKCLITIDDISETFVLFKIEAKNGEVWTYKILLKENLRAFKVMSGNWVINNPLCVFSKRKNHADNSVENLNIEKKLNIGYGNVLHHLSLEQNTASPIINILYIKGGKKILELINE